MGSALCITWLKIGKIEGLCYTLRLLPYSPVQYPCRYNLNNLSLHGQTSSTSNYPKTIAVEAEAAVEVEVENRESRIACRQVHEQFNIGALCFHDRFSSDSIFSLLCTLFRAYVLVHVGIERSFSCSYFFLLFLLYSKDN